MRLSPATAAVLLLALMLPGAASAGVVRVEGTTLVYEARPGEANGPSIDVYDSGAVLSEFSAPLEPGAGCEYEQGVTWVRCEGPITSAHVTLGDGDDSGGVDGAAAAVLGGDGADAIGGSSAEGVRLEGGPGDDVLDGGAGEDLLDGGPGQDDLAGHGADDHLLGGDGYDNLLGGGGADRLEGQGSGDALYGGSALWAQGEGPDLGDVLLGGDDDDLLHGAAGADELVGGPGGDGVSYSGATGPVSADLEGDADDGEPGEGDRIAEVSSLRGGSGADVLVGDDGDNSLQGDGGDDLLIGGRGADHVAGDAGDDRLFGAGEHEHGAGWPAGTPDDDRLVGGLGADRLVGGAGIDDLDGEEGPDLLEAREPPGHEPTYKPSGEPPRGEPVRCGPGADEALAEPSDFVFECEWVNGVELIGRPTAGPGGWQAPIGLGPARGNELETAITSDGVALALWEDSDPEPFAETRVMALEWPAGGPAGAPRALASSFGTKFPELATDGNGGAVATWDAPEHDTTAVAERRSGGTFGEAAILHGGDASVAATSAGGALAIAASPGERWDTAVRPAQASWDSWPTWWYLTDSYEGSEPAVAVTDAGDVHALWRTTSGRVVFSSRSDGGAPPATEVLAESGALDEPDLAVDGAGNAVALWRTEGRLHVAARPAGGRFGPPSTPPGGAADVGYLKGSVAADRSGRFTVAAMRSDGARELITVSSSRFGLPLEPVGAFSTRAWYEHPPQLDVSPSGETLLAWRTDHLGHWVTTRRSGDGPFGPVEDLDPDCLRADQAQFRVADTGRAVAGRSYDGRRMLSVGTPPEGTPRQECTPGAYGPPPPAGQAPPGPRRPAGPTAARAAQPRIAGLSLRRRRGRLSARLRVVCPVRCSVRGTVTLQRRGRAARRGRLAPRGVRGNRVLSVRLRKAGRRGSLRAGRGSLRAKLLASSAGKRRLLSASTRVRARARPR